MFTASPLLILLLSLHLLHKSSGLSIIGVIPPAYGHAYPINEILNAAANAGHTSTLFYLSCAFVKLDIPSSINTIVIDLPEEKCNAFGSIRANNLGFSIWEMGKIREKITAIHGTFNSAAIIKQIVTYINTTKVDVILCDSFTKAAIPIGKHFGIPVILVKHMVDEEISTYSYIPTVFSNFSMPLQFWQRIGNLMVRVMMANIFKLFHSVVDNEVIEVGLVPAEFPTLSIITSEFGLLIPCDLPPYVKVVGPLLTSKRQPVDEKVANILDEAEKSGKTVIYLSFGTAFELVKPQVEKLVSALARLENVLVLWPLTKDSQKENLPEKLPENVMTFPHLPQLQILSHPAVKLFISHCGANSAIEAMWAGVPVLAVPLIGDQFYLSSRLTEKKMAEKLDSLNFESEEFYDNVVKILNTPSYAINAKKMSALVTSAGGLKEALFHVERLAKLGSTELFLPERYNVPWYVVYELDVFLFFLVIFGLLWRLKWYICCCGCRCCRCCRKKGVTDKEKTE